jgi:hypothetical protein
MTDLYVDIPSWSGMVVFLRVLTKILSYIIVKVETYIYMLISFSQEERKYVETFEIQSNSNKIINI